MAAMDIARYLDDLGHEATQDWTETNNEALKAAGWKQDTVGPARATSTGGQSCFIISPSWPHQQNSYHRYPTSGT